MALDRKGSLWVYSYNYGIINYMNNKTFVLYNFKEFKNIVVTAMYVSKNESIYIGSIGKIFKLKNGKIEELYYENSINGVISYFFEDSSGNLLVGYSHGVLKIEENVVKRFLPENLKFNENVLSIYEDSYKNLWFGTINNGIFLYDREKLYQVSTKNGLYDSSVFTILEDEKGNLWMSGNNGIFCASIEELKSAANLIL